MASMIRDLLKTPQQIREERQNAMRERSAAQAALLSRGASGASTALPGLLRGFAAQQLVEQGPIADNLVRGGLLGLSSFASVPQKEIMASTSRVDPETLEPIGGGERVGTGQMTQRYPELAGALARASMSPEEQQAAVTSSIARQAGTNDPEKLRALADRLRKAGRPDAAEQFDERATKLEAESVQKIQSARIADVLDEMGRTDLAGLVRSGQAEPLEALKEARLGKEKPDQPKTRRVLTENARMPFELAYEDSEVLQQQLELAAEESQKNLNWWESNAPEFLGGAPSTDDKVTRLKEIIFEEALQIVDENTNPRQALEQATQKVLGTIQSGESATPSGNWVLKDGQWVQQ